MNDPAMFRLVRDTILDLTNLEESALAGQLSLGGEDFSFYAEQVPAVYYRVGCHTEGTPPLAPAQ